MRYENLGVSGTGDQESLNLLSAGRWLVTKYEQKHKIGNSLCGAAVSPDRKGICGMSAFGIGFRYVRNS
jgi:hypothetical protein